MTRPPGLLIVHPRAHRHALSKSLLAHLHDSFDLITETSDYAGHTSDICASRLKNFQGTVITAGGDGTLHEAVNAWADLGFPEGPRFAPLPLGTGNDFLFSANRDFRDPRTFLSRPLNAQRQADLGRVTYQTPDGPKSRYFCVGATAGFSAVVTFRRAEFSPKVPGAISYLLAMALCLGTWRNTSCCVRSEEVDIEHPVFFALNCANVKHYGGGMYSAPRADAFAGRLDGVSMNLTLPEAFRAMPQNFMGRFDGVPNVSQFPITQPLTLTTERPTLVQADGEPLGETPMTIECFPARLPVLLPAFSA